MKKSHSRPAATLKLSAKIKVAGSLSLYSQEGGLWHLISRFIPMHYLGSGVSLHGQNRHWYYDTYIVTICTSYDIG